MTSQQNKSFFLNKQLANKPGFDRLLKLDEIDKFVATC